MKYRHNNSIMKSRLHSCNDIITRVNKQFIDLTGFTTDELIGKSLMDIGDMIRINSQIHLDSISDTYIGYIFTKLLGAREVTIEVLSIQGTNEQVYTFVEKANSRLNNKMMFIEQMFIDNISGIAIYSVPDLILLKSNQRNLNFFDSPYNREENSIGRTLSEIVPGFEGTTIERIFNNVVETQKSKYLKQFELNLFERGVTYWDSSKTPILENGKIKYLVDTSIEVTELVLKSQSIEHQNKIVQQQKEQLEQQLEQKNIQLLKHNKQLDEKNMQLANILENLSEGIMVSDNKGDYILVNAEARRLIYKPHKVIAVGNSYENTKYFDMKGNEITRPNLPGTRALNGETIKNHTMLVSDPDRDFFMHSNSFPLYDNNGELTMSISCFYDVTETINQTRKIEEQKIQLEASIKIISEQNLQLNAILDNMTEGVMVTDTNGNFITANKISLQMHGLSSLDEYKNSKKIIGDYEAFSLEGCPIPRSEQAVSRALGGEIFNNFEVMVNRKDSGIKFIASYGGTPIYDENGEIVITVITIRDITEYKKVDEELKSQNKLLVAVIENMQDSLIIYDKNGRSIFMNAECHKRYPHLNIGNKTNTIYNSFCFNIDNNIISTENLPISRVLKGEIIRNERVIIKHADWTKYTEINATPIFDDKNNLVSAVISHHDITETIKNQNKIKKQQEQLLRIEKEKSKTLEETLKSQGEFVANISHELKTPLNVIFATAQLFEMYCNSGSLDEKKSSVIKYIHSIKQNSYRLSKLINNIVDSSKIEAGFFQLNLSNNDIVEVVEEIVMSVTNFTDSKGISVVFDTDIEEKIIACDPQNIERIVLNLISNSIKFTNKGGEILVAITDKNEFVEMSVKDNGIGIEGKDLDRIFNRFKQVDKSLSRNAEGTGIGLSLVKSIVELQGGRIFVESEFGKGSKFTVKLPTKMVMKENKLFNNNMKNKSESIKVEFSDIT